MSPVQLWVSQLFSQSGIDPLCLGIGPAETFAHGPNRQYKQGRKLLTVP